MCPIGRLRLERPIDDLGYLLILIRPGTSASQLVMQALDTEFDVALAPLSDGVLVQAHPLGDGGVGFALGPTQSSRVAPNHGEGRGNWRGS